MSKKYVANKAFIINPQNQVLFIRDSGIGSHAHAKGKWDIPGGRMDHGETALEGLVREIREEIGIEVNPDCARAFHTGLWGVGGDVENEPIVGIYYIVRIGDDPVVLSGEHCEHRWHDLHKPFPVDEMKSTIPEALQKLSEIESFGGRLQNKIKGHVGLGLIQLYTGNGKGKTTASLGQVIRAAGAGKKVGIVFFDKGGSAHYSERAVLDQLLNVDYVVTGRDRIDSSTGRFDFSVTDLDLVEAGRGLEAVEKMFISGYDLVVMDEINSTADLGMVSLEDVLAILEKKPDQTELVMTGRNAPQAFLDAANLVTEMKMHKHYFYSGVKARKGIDF